MWFDQRIIEVTSWSLVWELTYLKCWESVRSKFFLVYFQTFGSLIQGITNVYCKTAQKLIQLFGVWVQIRLKYTNSSNKVIWIFSKFPQALSLLYFEVIQRKSSLIQTSSSLNRTSGSLFQTSASLIHDSGCLIQVVSKWPIGLTYKDKLVWLNLLDSLIKTVKVLYKSNYREFDSSLKEFE